MEVFMAHPTYGQGFDLLTIPNHSVFLGSVRGCRIVGKNEFSDFEGAASAPVMLGERLRQFFYG